MGKFVDLTNQRFGRWLVQYKAPQKMYGKPAWAQLAGITPEGVAYRHKHGKDLL